MNTAFLAPITPEGSLKEYGSWAGIAFAVVCLLVLFLVVLPRLTSWRRGRGRPVMDPVQVSDLVSGSGALVVDLRNPETFRSGHIRGSLNVPFRELATRFAIPDPKARRSLILVDETDELSHLALDQLTAKGFSWVYVLQGGLRAWRRANFPIAR